MVLRMGTNFAEVPIEYAQLRDYLFTYVYIFICVYIYAFFSIFIDFWNIAAVFFFKELLFEVLETIYRVPPPAK